MNPVLPQFEYLPDPEARVWADGRLVVYGSRDVGGDERYCSDSYRFFSTDNLAEWTSRGTGFDVTQVPFSPDRSLYAPDCVFRDGLYYLYFCQGSGGGRVGVAVSNSPYGPFEEATPVAGADGTGIDPAVLIDEDGAAYLYWGQHALRAAQLAGDMRSIRPGTLQVGLLDEAGHGYHEGPSIRKIAGRYCLVYTDSSRGRATCLSHALADAPLGPFRPCGVILDNCACDPLSWNNHGSLCEFGGRWYLFYHRSSRHSRFNRRCCVEPVVIREDGFIAGVPMTLQGAAGPVPANRPLPAWRASSLYGCINTVVEDGLEFLASRRGGDFADFLSLSFNGERTCRALVRGKGGFTIHTGSRFSAPIASTSRIDSRDWTEVGCPLNDAPDGVASVHLQMTGGTIDLQEISFH